MIYLALVGANSGQEIDSEASTVHLQNIRHREILAMGREYLEIRLG